MSSKKTIAIGEAFVNKMKHKKAANLESTGSQLLFYGRVIAEWVGDRLFIQINGLAPASMPGGSLKHKEYTNGNFGMSQTTRNWINLIPNLSVRMYKKQLYIGNDVWDGYRKDVTDYFLGKRPMTDIPKDAIRKYNS